MLARLALPAGLAAAAAAAVRLRLFLLRVLLLLLFCPALLAGARPAPELCCGHHARQTVVLRAEWHCVDHTVKLKSAPGFLYTKVCCGA